MFIWHKVPAFKLLLAVIPGIILGKLIHFNQIEQIILIFGSVILSILLLKYSYRVISFLFLSILLGFIISNNSIENIIYKPKKIIPNLTGTFSGEILKINKYAATNIKLIAFGDLKIKGLNKLTNQKIFLTLFCKQNNPEIMNIQEGAEFNSNVKVVFSNSALLPDEFDFEKYLLSNDINWNLQADLNDFAINKEPNNFHIFISSINLSINKKINQLFNEFSSKIVKAMILGNKSEIEYDTKQRFSYSGTAHLLAISGLHVGIIAAGIHFVLIPLIRNKYLKTIIFSIVLIVFIFVSGVQDSAVRSGAMAIIWSFSYLSSRRIEPLNVASIVILFMLIFKPQYLSSVAFQMSSMAILGILIFYKLLKVSFKNLIRNNNILIKFAYESIAISLSASLIVSPLVAYYFGVFSLISPISNLIVLPLMSLSLVYAIIAILFSYIWLPIANIFANSTDFLIEISDILNLNLIKIPYSYFNDIELSIILSIIFSLLVIYFSLSKSRNQIVFRATSSTFIFILSFNLLQNHVNIKEYGVKVFPRKQLVLIEIPSHDTTRIILIDRKPKLNPTNDYALINYLVYKNENLKFYFSGNAGINIIDFVKLNKEVLDVPINLENQRLLKSKLNIHTELSQIIE